MRRKAIGKSRKLSRGRPIALGKSTFILTALLSRSMHYKYTPIQNILKILQPKKENFQIKKKSIDFGYWLEPLGEAGLMSTHNLCF